MTRLLQKLNTKITVLLIVPLQMHFNLSTDKEGTYSSRHLYFNLKENFMFKGNLYYFLQQQKLSTLKKKFHKTFPKIFWIESFKEQKAPLEPQL